MIRPLIIDLDARTRINAAVEEAKANPIPWEVLREHIVDDRDHPTSTLFLDDRRPTETERPQSIGVMIAMGYRAAISFEQQPAGLIRHLSISVDGKPGAMPNPAAVEMIAKEFGFDDFPPTHGRIWSEEWAPGEFAVNLVQIEDKS